MWKEMGMKVQKYSNYIIWEWLLYGDMSSPIAMGKLEIRGLRGFDRTKTKSLYRMRKRMDICRRRSAFLKRRGEKESELRRD